MTQTDIAETHLEFNETAVRTASALQGIRAQRIAQRRDVEIPREQLFAPFNRSGLGVALEYERMGNRPVSDALLSRSAEMVEYLKPLNAADAAAVSRIHFTVERRRIHSIESFATMTTEQHDAAAAFVAELEALIGVPDVSSSARDETVYARNTELKGPMTAFGYNYLPDKIGDEEFAALRLPKYRGSHGSGGEYAYEALNLVDGKRSVSDVRDWLTAELGPVPVEFVAEYLDALSSVGVIELRNHATGAASE
jgi:hypothetical protein